VRQHEPELFGRVRHILLPKDYIRFMLTGAYAVGLTVRHTQAHLTRAVLGFS